MIDSRYAFPTYFLQKVMRITEAKSRNCYRVIHGTTAKGVYVVSKSCLLEVGVETND